MTMAYFKVPFQHSPRGPEANNYSLSHDNHSACRDSKPGPPEQEGLLAITPGRLVHVILHGWDGVGYPVVHLPAVSRLDNRSR
jgi:hypothetical protein